VGFIDRMDETERELVRAISHLKSDHTRLVVQFSLICIVLAQKCTRRDGTAFTSALRTLHLKVHHRVN
jgi:hypothetical protein